MTSRIEWTNETWNPIVGCSAVSPGCDHCYAVQVAQRAMQPAHAGLVVNGQWSGELRFLPDRLDVPLQWPSPRRVFVCSMSDLFHPEVLKAEHAGQPFLAHVFARMVAASQHTFQILTKRPQVMAAVLAHPQFRLDVNSILFGLGYRVMPGGMTDPAFVWPRNLWLGTSIENDRYTFRADHLRATGAAVRFLSLEPLLGPLPSLDLTGIDWVIAGGESGPGARPMHPDWVRALRDATKTAGAAFFFKQWGAWSPPTGDINGARAICLEADGTILPFVSTPADDPAVTLHRVRKRHAGRDLDGRTWDEFPAGHGGPSTPQKGAGVDGPASEGDGRPGETTPVTGPLDAVQPDGADSHDVGRTVPEPAPATEGLGASVHADAPNPLPHRTHSKCGAA